ncbi:SDR family oxidoreductase [Candidatus Micrarchaeota archaeon]|nr:SDR family oxidoreductase [Candidatus Micrarchaeota archaeon]
MAGPLEHVRGTVLITGASSGIGFELAKLFAKDGYCLVLVARKKDALENSAKELRSRSSSPDISITTIPKDLSIPDSAQEIFDELTKQKIKIDILVNNAGFGNYGFFYETNWITEQKMIQLNIASLTELTKLSVKQMVERKYGKILNVASTAAFQPGPLMAVYYATKAYVLHFSEALANELKGTGVTVTTLCPGPTVSSFQKTAEMEKSRIANQPSALDNPEHVAKVGYDALMKGKTVVIPGFKNNLFAFLVRLTPRDIVTSIVRQVDERI